MTITEALQLVGSLELAAGFAMWDAKFEAHVLSIGGAPHLRVMFSMFVRDRLDRRQLNKLKADRLFHELDLATFPEAWFLRNLRDFALELITHEFDESFRRDGKLVNDPHSSESDQAKFDRLVKAGPPFDPSLADRIPPR